MLTGDECVPSQAVPLQEARNTGRVVALNNNKEEDEQKEETRTNRIRHKDQRKDNELIQERHSKQIAIMQVRQTNRVRQYRETTREEENRKRKHTGRMPACSPVL